MVSHVGTTGELRASAVVSAVLQRDATYAPTSTVFDVDISRVCPTNFRVVSHAPPSVAVDSIGRPVADWPMSRKDWLQCVEYLCDRTSRPRTVDDVAAAMHLNAVVGRVKAVFLGLDTLAEVLSRGLTWPRCDRVSSGGGVADERDTAPVDV
jgi:hypothetical protein